MVEMFKGAGSLTKVAENTFIKGFTFNIVFVIGL
jgi:hypothetical protein